MKWTKTIPMIGAVTIFFGVIFHFQGQAMIGPESSFMYSNPDWINYGFQIAITGTIITIVGLCIPLLKKRK